jgi:hypothetical protein
MDDVSVIPAFPAPVPAPYRDRSTLLVVFGIVQIILGLFFLMFIPFVLLGAVMSRKMGGGLPIGFNLLNIATYGMIAMVLITLGVGSIRAQRWAHDLTLVISWIWLVSGVLGTGMLVFLLPSSLLAGFRVAAAQNPQAGPLPAGVMAVILTIVIAFFAFFLVVLPIVFVAFYHREDVAETCRHRDPTPRWTERTPLPLLALSVLFTFGAVYYFLMAFAVPVYPFFGRYLTGLPAGLILVTVAMIEAVLAVLVFRRQIAGWWIALIALLFRCAAVAFTIGHSNLLDAYSKMGMSGRQLDMMRANPMFGSGAFLWLGLAYAAPLLVFLIWTRKYFSSPAPPAAPEPDPAPLA